MSELQGPTVPPRNAWTLFAALLLSLPLTATAANLASLTVNPTTVVSGSPLTMTITLDGPAPAGGAAVTLSSDPPGIVNFVYFPLEIMDAGVISEGTQPQVSADTATTVTLHASWGGVTVTVAVLSTPPQEAVMVT